MENFRCSPQSGHTWGTVEKTSRGWEAKIWSDETQAPGSEDGTVTGRTKRQAIRRAIEWCRDEYAGCAF